MKEKRGGKGLQKVHLLGICGTAMAALAGGLQEMGCRVTGSDEHVYPPMSDQLATLGIPIQQGYRPDHIPEDTELVVVGNVIRESNPEAVEMRRRELPYISMASAVHQYLIAGRDSLVVAGTHGKTTTTSLAAHTLTSLGADPGFLVGGIALNFNSNFGLGGGKYFVIEGDEYDTAYFDKTPKFFKYHPKALIFTSLEFDHADIYSDIGVIRKHFSSLISSLPADGLLVANGDDPEVAGLLEQACCKVITYGLNEGADYRVVDWKPEGRGGSFNTQSEGRIEKWRIAMPGVYNAFNAVAVSILAGWLGFGAEEINRAFGKFQGVKRRQEFRGVEAGVTVIDDFAHHPTAVRLTIEAIRSIKGDDLLWAVFEPRSFTARGDRFQNEFGPAFLGADRVILAPPFQPEGGQDAIPLKTALLNTTLLNTTAIAEYLTNQGVWAMAATNSDEILECLLKNTHSGDHVLIMSNGGFDDLHDRLLTGLKNKSI